MFQPIHALSPELAEFANTRPLIINEAASGGADQERPVRSTSAYSGGDIQDFRRALRLAAKLHRMIESAPPGEPEVYHYHDEGLSRTSQAAECALLLTLARMPKDLVLAGALFNSLEGFRGGDLDKRKDCISEKFGRRVVDLIELSAELRCAASAFKCEGRYGMLRQRLNSQGRADQLQPAAAIAAAAMACEGRFIGGKELIIMVAAANVPPVIVSELLRQSPEISTHECAGVIREQLAELEPSLAYTGFEIECIRRSAQLSLEIFRDTLRPWGEKEEMPLAIHDFEVGLMLAASGANSDTIQAGLLHDGLEEYVRVPLARIHQLVAMHSSGRTLALINQQTEPPKRVTEESFWARKKPVVEALQNGDTDLAELIVAAKTSTLAFGNKYLLQTGKITGWSKGSFIDNLDLYQVYHLIGQRMGVAQPLLDALEAEIVQFAELGERFKLLCTEIVRSDTPTDENNISSQV